MDRLAGRDRELARIRGLLAEVAHGSPRALVVHGEAGVGKTRLVREALADPDLAVVWGTCVHFGASTVPFAPLVSALRPWRGDRDGDLDTARLIPVVDRTLQRLAAEATTVLVVDDLQWADVSSLDALAFVISGFREERLAVIATCRDEDRPPGSLLHGWLADVRRMPGFEEMQLGRLDLDGTEALVAGHLGRPVDIGLAAQVHERSGGNSYLAELLVRDLPPGARRLPASAPAALAQALTARWHGLSPTARTVAQMLAVGGRPSTRDVLTQVAAGQGMDAVQVAAALEEALEHGVVAADPDVVWFRHPMLAEVLERSVPPNLAGRVHATYAELLEEEHDVPERRRADDLAVHHLRAGHLEDAYRWSLRAADAAAEADSASEAVHLERACVLWHDLTVETRADVASYVALLRRTARVDERVGRLDHAVRLVEQARSLVSPEDDPLLASSVLSQWCELVWQRDAPDRAVRPELFEALRLADGFPDSAERVEALTGLASAYDWDGDLPQAQAWASLAVDAARRSGSDAALINAWSMQARVLSDHELALGLARQAHDLARRNGDGERMTEVAIWQVNLLIDLDRAEEAMSLARDATDEGLALGTVAWSWFLAGLAASLALDLGDWGEARRLVRAALATRPVAIPGAHTHLIAAQHATVVGEPAEARAHLDRAPELVPQFFVGLRYDLARAQMLVLTAEGEPEQALERLVALRRHIARDDRTEDLSFLAWAAAAAADMAEAARDHGDPEAARSAVARLDALVVEVGAPSPAEGRTRIDRHQVSRFEAERARCRRAGDEEQRWEAAAVAADQAGLAWDRSYALWRQAQAMARAHAPRARLSGLLREAHAIASRLGAAPLVSEIEQLATSARVSLAVVEAATAAPDGRDIMAALTAREREVLAHLVAGHSNGEIGQELVISEKTVSVHVSNILRKTGTTSRVEAAALAQRLS